MSEDNKTRVCVRLEIGAPAEKVWATLMEIDGVEKFAPWVASSKKTDDGRIIYLKDGVELYETITVPDPFQMELCFAITGSSAPVPVRNYHGVMRVEKTAERRCAVEWRSEFEPQGMPAQEVVNMLREMHTSAIKQLEALHATY